MELQYTLTRLSIRLTGMEHKLRRWKSVIEKE